MSIKEKLQNLHPATIPLVLLVAIPVAAAVLFPLSRQLKGLCSADLGFFVIYLAASLLAGRLLQHLRNDVPAKWLSSFFLGAGFLYPFLLLCLMMGLFDAVGAARASGGLTCAIRHAIVSLDCQFSCLGVGVVTIGSFLATRSWKALLSVVIGILSGGLLGVGIGTLFTLAPSPFPGSEGVLLILPGIGLLIVGGCYLAAAAVRKKRAVLYWLIFPSIVAVLLWSFAFVLGEVRYSRYQREILSRAEPPWKPEKIVAAQKLYQYYCDWNESHWKLQSAMENVGIELTPEIREKAKELFFSSETQAILAEFDRQSHFPGRPPHEIRPLPRWIADLTFSRMRLLAEEGKNAEVKVEFLRQLPAIRRFASCREAGCMTRAEGAEQTLFKGLIRYAPTDSESTSLYRELLTELLDRPFQVPDYLIGELDFYNRQLFNPATAGFPEYAWNRPFWRNLLASEYAYYLSRQPFYEKEAAAEIMPSELVGKHAGDRVSNRLLDSKQQRMICQTGIALKLYHCLHGKYPENLDALVPELLARLPFNFKNGKAPWPDYQKTESGFLLYSPNGAYYSIYAKTNL